MRSPLGMSVLLRHATAWVSLLALSVTAVGPVLHGVHDTDCDPPIVLHDATRHHFAAAPSAADETTGSDHCVACHFQRTSRGPVSWEPTGLQALISGNLLHDSDGRLVTPPSVSPQPARAPPHA